MGFPKPPIINRNKTEAFPATPKEKREPPPKVEPLPTPEIKAAGEKLTETEVEMILRTSLLPHHREDANILKFIASYIRCRDAKQAAKEAGLHPVGGANLRNRVDIHLAITRLTEKAVMKYGFDASEMVERAKEIATFDPIELENEDGSFKTNMKDISPESRRAIKKFKAKNLYENDPNGMKVLVGQIIEVEMYDKLRGIELLGREKDIFKETKKVEHDVTGRMADLLLESKKRADDYNSDTIDITPKLLGEGGQNDVSNVREEEEIEEK